jgi:hypothetical protein
VEVLEDTEGAQASIADEGKPRYGTLDAWSLGTCVLTSMIGW